MTHRCSTRPGWLPGLGVLTMAATWLGGLALAGNLALPAWALPAAAGVLAGVCAWFYALTRLSHGGPWGWTGLQHHRSHRPSHRPPPARTAAPPVRTTVIRDEDQ